MAGENPTGPPYALKPWFVLAPKAAVVGIFYCSFISPSIFFPLLLNVLLSVPVFDPIILNWCWLAKPVFLPNLSS